MSNLPAHRHRLFPAVNDWLTGFPPVENLRPLFEGRLIKVEEEITDGKYLLRAELPGVDPAKDIAVTVREGVLTITAERSERKETKGRTEFGYGSFTRSIALPAGAAEDDISAKYDQGILTVSIPVTEPEKTQERRIAVETGG
ncbi:Hsp20/alpha crystallin family protein [Nocardia canadensis]|uniref:Hsp20/alpha crystallin family protein n=1 Tax=Nocardia canadensis TaxID=3065238 RepID=UPI00292FB0D0|nr:Hsp20/alpha crystallin family protein [Nocardia canadensis]